MAAVEHYMRRADTPAVLDPSQPKGLVYRVDGDVAVLHVGLFDGADPFAHDFPQALGDGYDRDDPLPFL
ncbi:MAG: hypothetical protein SGJ13_16660 [Actinomycetota bacterium]|nr:hypothetical protein [Actinomycetota bacterium]